MRSANAHAPPQTTGPEGPPRRTVKNGTRWTGSRWTATDSSATTPVADDSRRTGSATPRTGSGAQQSRPDTIEGATRDDRATAACRADSSRIPGPEARSAAAGAGHSQRQAVAAEAVVETVAAVVAAAGVVVVDAAAVAAAAEVAVAAEGATRAIPVARFAWEETIHHHRSGATS